MFLKATSRKKASTRMMKIRQRKEMERRVRSATINHSKKKRKQRSRRGLLSMK